MKQKKQFLKPSISYMPMPVQNILSGSDGGSSSIPPMSVFGTNATHTEGGIQGGNGGDGL